MDSQNAGLENAENPIPSLYPKRVSEDVEDVILEIEKLMDGREKPINLNAEERRELMASENILGESLEKIFDLTVSKDTVYLDYFLTEKGREELGRLFPEQEIPAESKELKRFILINTPVLASMDAKERSKLMGSALKYADNGLKKNILDGEGTMNVSDAIKPESFEIVLNPGVLSSKVKALRQFRKECRARLKETGTDTGIGIAQTEILNMYRIRSNEMLMECYPFLYAIRDKMKLAGEQGVTDDEREILSMFKTGGKSEKGLSRIDKMLYGAGREFHDGEQRQVSPFLEQRVDVLKVARSINESQKEELVKQRGLDPAKVFKAEIDSENRADWGEQILSQYGLLSSSHRETYSPDRNGPADDGLWQYVPVPDRNSKVVLPKKKVVLDPSTKTEDVVQALTVGLGHEIEGHVLQQVNKAKIPLRLFKKVGGDRRSAMSEGGAMYVQNRLSEEMFGFKSMPHPHYIAAMKRRLDGGSYLDCVKAFYESAIEEVKTKYDLGDEKQKKAFLAEAGKTADLAISRVRRLFGNADLEAKTGLLTNSKDTVYMEQELLIEKLAEKGLLKLAFIGHMNLRNVAALLRLGLIDLSEISEPRFFTKDIWESIKGRYI